MKLQQVPAMNASSTGSTMFYQYADRIELLNSGGLYGRVNRENFPGENSQAGCGKRCGKDSRFAEAVSRHHEGTLGEKGGALGQRRGEESGAIEVRRQDRTCWRPQEWALGSG